MRHFQGARTMFVGFLTTLLLTAGGMVVAVHADDDEGTWALKADQAIACIQTALSTQAGLVKEVEAEDEGGQQFCEVKIVDAAGHTHKLHIDVDTHQVIKVN